MKRTLIASAAVLLLVGGGVFAQKPVQNVSAAKHPNLAAAQHLTQQAWDKLVAAQKANEFDMGGHAQKAKDLLDQANKEIKAAAEVANAGRR